jgi:AbiV family abortive infection protein
MVSIAECRRGFDLTCENALRLESEARNALARNEYLSAALIGAYSFDEFGKALILAKCIIDAMDGGKSDISERELRQVGCFDHHRRLERVGQIFVPILTGLPPGHVVTEDFIRQWKDRIWQLRNAVAYVDLNGEQFVSPAAFPRGQCEQLVEVLPQFIAFMNDDVGPYLDRQFNSFGSTA